MARRVSVSSPRGGQSTNLEGGNPPSTPPIHGATGSATGRYLVLLEPDDAAAGSLSLTSGAGLKLASVGGGDAGAGAFPEGEGIVFQEIGVAVVHAAPDRLSALSSTVAASSALRSLEPERYVHAIGGFDASYLRGYRDAIDHLVEKLTAEDAHQPVAAAGFADAQLSWGLQATGVGMTRYTGRGVKVAVLDTGLALAHPDFAGRNVQSRSFVAEQDVEDDNGHGTHCCGVACGPRRPGRLPRFGVASEADLFVGKVLGNDGRGVDADIIAGIQWALQNGCDVISMSLGAPVQAGQAYSPIFQQIAQRAMARGTLIAVASGNESDRRRGLVAPVGHPANCPSMIAVAAVDRNLAPAYFSCGASPASNTKIDIAGPGVDVISSWPLPDLYKSESGTSMATPHVAGNVALFAEANPGSRGGDLWARLVQRARALAASNYDVGAGLVQAP